MKIYCYYGFDDFIICGEYKCNLIKDYFYKLPMYESDVTFNYSNKFNMNIYESNNEITNWNVIIVDTGLDIMIGGRIKK